MSNSLGKLFHRTALAFLLMAGVCLQGRAEPVQVPYGATMLTLKLRDDAWILLPDASGAKMTPDTALDSVGLSALITSTSKHSRWLELATPSSSKRSDQGIEALPAALRSRIAAVASVDGVPASPERWIAVAAKVSVRFAAPPADPAAWLLTRGLVSARRIANLRNTWLGDVAGAPGTSIQVAASLRALPEVAEAAPLLLRPMAPRFLPDDSFFSDQWTIYNTGTKPGAVAGNDANLPTAWDEFDGAGINIGIIDEGVEQTHSDLAENLLLDLQLDVVDNDFDPTPDVGVSHGTSVAGIAAAVGNNAAGICGVAFGAGLAGIRYVSDMNTPEAHAMALSHTALAAVGAPHIDVFNMSYGPLDDGIALEAPGPLELDALETGVGEGRDGKGVIYTWASGNGREAGDDANYDGFASSLYVIAVAASGSDGLVSYYSEPGASIMLNAPSSYSNIGGTGVITTANGNFYATAFGGTSAAAPLVAGVAALVLEANPKLGWRDVQHVLIDSAQQNDANAASWITNATGRAFSRDYGFGRVDAGAAVALAQRWRRLPAWIAPLTASESVGLAIPDNDATGLSRSLSIDAPWGFVVERVIARVSATHTFRGDLNWTLSSPQGTSILLARGRGDEGDVYTNWPLASLATWGESAGGTWTLQVQDLGAFDTGDWDAWSLEIYGYQRGHTADQDADHRISLVELLRLIQFYNLGVFHCEIGTEDGYAPESGDQSCAPHANDYAPQDWVISLGELLRLIQFYNSGGYTPCEGGEDGFCPGG